MVSAEEKFRLNRLFKRRLNCHQLPHRRDSV